MASISTPRTQRSDDGSIPLPGLLSATSHATPSTQHSEPRTQHSDVSMRSVPESDTSELGAANYLRELLNKNFHVTATDGRLFVGQFKCTDADTNVVLQHTYEYRRPSAQAVAEAAAAAGGDGDQGSGGGGGAVKVDMTSRYLGLVVVPGKYIEKIEVEEFISQMKTRSEPQSQSPPEDTAFVREDLSMVSGPVAVVGEEGEEGEDMSLCS